MKVLVICEFPPVPLPEANHAFLIVKHLADAGVTVDVLNAKNSVAVQHQNGTQHSTMEKWDWSELLKLAWCIKRSKPDAILLYYLPFLYNSHPMITIVPTLARVLMPSAAVLTLFSTDQTAEVHTYPFIRKAVYKLLLLGLGRNTHYNLGTLLRDSHRIIGLSQNHLQKLISFLPQASEKAVLIPPPLLIPLSPKTPEVRQEGRKQLAVTEGMFLFAYFGMLYPAKGVETLLHAFSLVAAENDKVRLAVIGAVMQTHGGPEYGEMVQALVAELGLSEKVVFTGSFDWDSTQGSVYLRAADACVLPFDRGVQVNNSSFGAVVTHGLPVITTSGQEMEAPFQDGVNLLLCPPQNPRAMAAAMLQVVQDDALRRRLSEGALRFSEEWYSWNSATQRTLDALQSSHFMSTLNKQKVLQ